VYNFKQRGQSSFSKVKVNPEYCEKKRKGEPKNVKPGLNKGKRTEKKRKKGSLRTGILKGADTIKTFDSLSGNRQMGQRKRFHPGVNVKRKFSWPNKR